MIDFVFGGFGGLVRWIFIYKFNSKRMGEAYNSDPIREGGKNNVAGLSLIPIAIIIGFIINSCQKKESDLSFKKENIRNVNFEIPVNFSLKKSNSIDTEVYNIFSDKKLVGSVYLGAYYKPFVEDYSVTEEKEVYQMVNSKEAKIYYSKYVEQDYKNGIYNDNYYYYDTINRNIAQIMLPKKNKGSIGVYFDSIDIHKNKLAIISNDLSEENKNMFLKIFKTIKIE